MTLGKSTHTTRFESRQKCKCVLYLKYIVLVLACKILDDFISRIIVTRGLQKLNPEAEIIYF